MFFGALESQQWQPFRHWDAEASGLTKAGASVLTTAGSLTRFLERHFGIKLEVRMHDQFVDKAMAEEAQLLGCESGATSLRRQVSLMHRGSVLFDAESVLPLEFLPADLMRDLEEGERPLGNLLLDRGLSLSRSDLAICAIEATGDIHGCWARRSVLKSPSGTRALVVEVFHPEMWRRIDSTARRYSVREP